MKTIMLVILSTTILCQPAQANYRYKVNRYGTGYFRDTSNDGLVYNNANVINMNSHLINGGRIKVQR